MRPTLIVAFAALTACGGGTSAPEAPSCDLSVDSLAGKAFVELEIQGDKSEKPNPMARIKFDKKDGKLTAGYTVKNALHVYPYTCEATKREGEVKCLTEPQWKRLCLSYEVNKEDSCSLAQMRKDGFEGGDEAEIGKAIEAAKKLAAEARKSEQWKQFQLINNNVANTIQGQLFVKVDTKNCRVSLDDMFVTVFNGKRTEDFNPVGSNPFVKADAEYLYEDCTVEGVLVDLAEDALPSDLKKIPPVREHKVGTPVHYHYAADAGLKAEEGCTYSVDTWANWKSVAKGTAIEPVDGKVAWSAAHTWGASDLMLVGKDRGKVLKGGFFHMARRKTCNGETSTIDVVCNAARVAE